MKVAVFALAFFGVVCAVPRPEEKYTIKYDNVDLQEILQSDRLTGNYADCLLDKKPCTPDGGHLKSVLPDALKTNCAKCSDKQKIGAKTVINHLYKNKPDIWHQLEAKYDPEGKYRKEHEEELKAL
ncbi:OS-D domain containing protein [Asbolus verrucosus]|uniref:OS-D domain containing protein n=1 Tax=Asbolus verrucosus TaxID=1661398 RepID=A0A482WC16_ASBVE|nr:OS-D domain containing protein [Asbolus verrucosus]